MVGARKDHLFKRLTDPMCRDLCQGSDQNRFSNALAEDPVPRSIPPVAAEESGSAVGAGGPVEVPASSTFFLLPKETPQLFAKLAKVALAVAPVPVGFEANGDVRGT